MRLLWILLLTAVVNNSYAQVPDYLTDKAFIKKNKIKQITFAPAKSTRQGNTSYYFSRHGSIDSILLMDSVNTTLASVKTTVSYDSLGRIRLIQSFAQDSFINNPPIIFASGDAVSESRTDYIYNTEGKLWMMITIDTNGVLDKQVTYTYNPTMQSTRYYSGGNVVREQQIYFDAHGNPSRSVNITNTGTIEESEITGVYQNKYDKRKRLLSSAYSDDAGCKSSVTYAYNKKGLLTRKTSTGCLLGDSGSFTYLFY